MGAHENIERVRVAKGVTKTFNEIKAMADSGLYPVQY